MTRWLAETGGDRGESYAANLAQRAGQGQYQHGEADLVDQLSPAPSAVLDAGCGTGRVGIELSRRGHRVIGVDSDASMLAVARRQAPEMEWRQQDLASLELPSLGLDEGFDVVLLAGNVMIFVESGTEAAVVTRCAAHLRPGGLLIAGFRTELALPAYDEICATADLTLQERWATWERSAYDGGDYAVSVHRRLGGAAGAPLTS